ncbi:MAG: hypothetical protein GY949_19485, partial [Gammaproteobacteria bacterium]|nr:hypothetical protein [Gammaproteobacteria bacterium]
MTQYAMTEKTEPWLGSEPVDHAAAKAATMAAIEAARGEMRRNPTSGDEQRPNTSTEPDSPSDTDTTTSPVSSAAAGAVELRVLQGPQIGARTLLNRTHMVIATDGEVPAGIADQDESVDILLFDDPREPVHIRLAFTDALTAVQVLHGQIRLQDQVLNTGEERAWEMYQPLTIGQSIIAYGLSKVSRWPTYNENATASEPGGNGSDMQDKPPSNTNTGNSHRANSSLTTILGGVAIVCIAAFWQLSTGAYDALQAPMPNPVDLVTQMRTSPFAQLSAVRKPDGEFLVRG